MLLKQLPTDGAWNPFDLRPPALTWNVVGLIYVDGVTILALPGDSGGRTTRGVTFQDYVTAFSADFVAAALGILNFGWDWKEIMISSGWKVNKGVQFWIVGGVVSGSVYYYTAVLLREIKANEE